MSTEELAVLFLGLGDLALIGAGAWVVHRLSDRIRVAAPPKHPQSEAGDAPVREIRRPA